MILEMDETMWYRLYIKKEGEACLGGSVGKHLTPGLSSGLDLRIMCVSPT